MSYLIRYATLQRSHKHAHIMAKRAALTLQNPLLVACHAVASAELSIACVWIAALESEIAQMRALHEVAVD